METALVEDLADAGAAEFDTLDRSAGAAGCYHRLRQRQADRRWVVRYLLATDGGGLAAAVPVCRYRGKAWHSRHYDVTAWPLPGGPRADLIPAACLLVGGCTDGRSSLHVRRDGGHPALRRLVAELAALAAAEDRCLVFPFLTGADRLALTEATGGRVAWTPLRRDAQLRRRGDAGWDASLGSRARGTLRRDRTLIEAAALDRSTHRWPEVADETSALIADHNARKGEPDHPEFARLRYAEWEQCEGVDLVVLRAVADGVTGVLTALVWQDELQLCEIGLTPADRPHRLAAYLDLVFHRPLALARDRGLRTIRVGSAAEVPKRSRGAVFEELYGGVLDRPGILELADGRG